MEQKPEIKKFIRRTTRSKTQFINFNKDEINNLRLEVSGNNLNKNIENKDVSQVKNILKSSENILKSPEIVNDTINLELEQLKITNQEQLKNDKVEESTSIFKSKIVPPTKNQISDIKPDDVFGKKIIFNNTPVEKYKPMTEKEQRTYSFSELLDWVHKKEKRDLFPKNKFDYVYKKNKNDCKNKIDNENDERNVIHMRIEEDIIPCLNSNPFVQADKYFRKN